MLKNKLKKIEFQDALRYFGDVNPSQIPTCVGDFFGIDAAIWIRNIL